MCIGGDNCSYKMISCKKLLKIVEWNAHSENYFTNPEGGRPTALPKMVSTAETFLRQLAKHTCGQLFL